ncbi:hypothetical protein PVK06_021319 [Gossypium arboreum]|uniref:Mannosyltransferase n=1 Tax=Gossypium arboreum TaxID=29729 RepID=A0ABR0PPN8_GOSAR|nr:hypothetical protein PVK06_021319 [Gossypium arboreum]
MPDLLRNLIHLRWPLKLVDFRVVDELSWGSTVLATLYREMCGATKRNKPKSEVAYHYDNHRLDFTFYFYVLEFYNYYIDLKYNFMLKNYLIRWNHSTSYVGTSTALENIMLLLDQRSEAHLQWTPYEDPAIQASQRGMETAIRGRLSLSPNTIFNPKPGFLPSSFSMYAMSLSSGLFLLEKPAWAVAVAAVGVILGWPFSILAFLPLTFYSLDKQFKQAFLSGAVTSIALLFVLQALSILVDHCYYQRWTSSVFNLLVYNVLGGGESHLYGTEGPLFYIRNGFNNFNFCFILALLFLGILPNCKKKMAKFLRPVALSLILCASHSRTFSLINGYAALMEVYKILEHHDDAGTGNG